MSAPYTPKPDSLAASVVHFFSVNPDEELTLDDISDKFDAGRNNIHTQLGRAVEAGLLIRGTNDDGDYIYTAGKALPATQARTGGPAPAQSTPFRNTTRVDVDQLVLVVDKNVPMPNGTVCKWDALFDKLTDVGDSIAVPASIVLPLRAETYKRNKRGPGVYRVLSTGKDTARIWRIAPPTKKNPGARS